MIQRVSLALVLIFASALSGAAFASQVPEEAMEDAGQGRAEAREALLDRLFERLAEAETEEAGRAAERAIQSVWLDSGSASIDLLTQRGLDALAEDDIDRAYFYFDEVVTLAPDFAEGWHRRATIYYLAR